MRHCIFILACCLFFTGMRSQVTENFNDGDISANPVWTGNTADFTITASGQLRSNNTNTNTAFYIATSNTLTANCQWEFWCNLQFNPSGNNYADIYLVSDNSNLLDPIINGYFVRIGGSTDEVSLYLRNGATSTKIIDGTDGILNTSSNTLKVKVSCNAAHVWTLSRDLGGTGTSYVPEGNVTDLTFTSGLYAGILVQQSTASFFQKHYFDDLVIGPMIQDLTPPSVVSAALSNAYQVDVLFDENVDLATSQTFSNYTISPGIGNPNSAVRNSTNNKQVRLFTSALTSGTHYTLSVSQVQDLYGNAIATSTVGFSYYKAKPYDIVINELMPDPDPVQALPNAEYIELKNRSAFPLNLQNWSITVNSTVKKLPVITIQPDSFVVLTPAGTSTAMAAMGITSYDLSGFPSLANSGATVSLRDSSGMLIHSVSYTDDWYHDSQKKNGGWSLEQIDAANPCGDIDNWRASVNASGGTPGKQNSSKPDTQAPILKRIGVPAPDTLLLFFSEAMDSASLMNSSLYIFDHGLGTPTAILPIANDFKKVKLALPVPLQTGTMYHGSLNAPAYDCAGNIIHTEALPFALPDAVVENDIVINEVLFNPHNGGYDFVELYNRSSKTVDLNTLFLGSMDTLSGLLLDTEPLSTESHLFFPGTYLVLSENGHAIKQQYFSSNPEGFVDMETFPAMNNDEDIVCLSNTAAVIIDRLIYSETMHFPLLADHRGVSLERIDYNRPAGDRSNWNSAAPAVGFATPAYRNSQYMTSEGGNGVSIGNPIFSPDNDGYQDVLDINYSFDEAGKAANIYIYDSKGREVKHLVKNEQLMQKGTLSWNGITDNNEKAPIGIYVIYAEVFNTKGQVNKYKLSCVLAGKLR